MRHLIFLALMPITLACGGAVGDGEGGNNSPSVVGGSGGEGVEPGTGGTSSGGAGVAGGSAQGGVSPNGGVSWGGVANGGMWNTGAVGQGGGVACCLAAAVCDPNDVEIAGPAECPVGAECYSSHICCSTVWCVRSGGAAMDGGSAACNPEAEYGREYVGSSPEECALIDFACSGETTYFGNACGCGCEQDPSCPEWIDCMPGPEPNPACSDEALAHCPYSGIAQ